MTLVHYELHPPQKVEPLAVPQTVTLSYPDAGRWLDDLALQGGIDICPKTYGDTLCHPDWGGDAICDRCELALL